MTDGSRIYFGETTSTNFAIAQVSGAGGETGKLDLPIANPLLMGISGDQSGLLVGQVTVTDGAFFLNGGPYWSVPMPAGSPRRLGDRDAMHSAAQGLERSALGMLWKVDCGRQVLRLQQPSQRRQRRLDCRLQAGLVAEDFARAGAINHWSSAVFESTA